MKTTLKDFDELECPRYGCDKRMVKPHSIKCGNVKYICDCGEEFIIDSDGDLI